MTNPPTDAGHPPLPDRVDVLVVGARAAGAATALLLARAGAEVLVVDRAAPGADTRSTHALMRTGVVQLSRWGLLDRLVAAGTPWVRRTTFHYGDLTATVDVRPDRWAEGLCAPRRTVLDPVLSDAAAAAGADVRHGVHLDALVHDPLGRVVGARLRRGGQHLVLACDLVVGADGLHSKVARSVRAEVTERGRWSTASTYAHVAGLEVDGYQWHFGLGVASGAIPTNDGRTCVFAAVPSARFDDEIRPDVTAGFWRTLRRSSPALAAEVADRGELGPLRTFAGHVGQLRQAAGPGWALVGDAGHFDDPSTAHGISGALKDAELLARSVVEDQLDEYEPARDALAHEVFRATDAISAMGELDELQRHHLALSEAMRAEADEVGGWSLPGGPVLVSPAAR